MTENNDSQRTEQLRYVLDGIHGWNKSVDGKAGFVAAFATLALGWTVDDAAVLIATTGICSVLISASVIGLGGGLAASAVFPVVSIKGKPWSALFFHDIAGRFGSSGQLKNEAEKYAAELEKTFEATLAEQILANAIIARKKFILIKCSALVTLFGTFLVMVLHLFSAVNGDRAKGGNASLEPPIALTQNEAEEYEIQARKLSS